MCRPSAFPTVAAAVLADRLLELCSEPAATHVSLALSGGSTPGPVYGSLARAGGVRWERVRIYFADERAVPPTEKASNYYLVRRCLLEVLPTAPAAVCRMEADDSDLEQAAARYEASLPEALDLLILGIGRDGHTASLFPGSPLLGETARRVAVARSPIPPSPRLTITPPVIRAARSVYVLAHGADKSRRVRQALQGAVHESDCPARLARGRTWILDEEAARLLEG